MKRKKKLIILLAIISILILASAVVYLNTYYKADESLETMASEDSNVTLVDKAKLILLRSGTSIYRIKGKIINKNITKS